MPIFFFKSALALLMFILIFIAMFTMFEIFGRSDKRYNIEKLKKIHKVNGIIFIVLFFVISYLCLDFIINTKTEPSVRAVFHGVFALAVLILLFLKSSFVRFYRQFYDKVQMIGIVVAILSFLMIGTSAGYYFLINKFSNDVNVGVIAEQKKEAFKESSKIVVRTDPESIAKGKDLFESKCYFCHEAYSNHYGVGPGHKGILKNPLLPVSKKPATPENVASQIRRPFKDMPAFTYLSDEEINNIIAFLNTL